MLWKLLKIINLFFRVGLTEESICLHSSMLVNDNIKITYIRSRFRCIVRDHQSMLFLYALITAKKGSIFLFTTRFGVTEDSIKECLEGLTMSAAICKKRLFIVDLEILDGITCVEGYIVRMNFTTVTLTYLSQCIYIIYYLKF